MSAINLYDLMPSATAFQASMAVVEYDTTGTGNGPFNTYKVSIADINAYANKYTDDKLQTYFNSYYAPTNVPAALTYLTNYTFPTTLASLVAAYTAMRVDPININNENITFLPQVLGTSPALFRKALNLPDGRVFLLNETGLNNCYIYDPATSTFTALSFNATGQAYGGACLLPNGTVFLTPANVTNPAIYDPISDTLSVLPYQLNAAVNLNGFNDCICFPNGKVFLCPAFATQPYIYDYTTDTFTKLTHAAGSAYNQQPSFGQNSYTSTPKYGHLTLISDTQILITLDSYTTDNTALPIKIYDIALNAYSPSFTALAYRSIGALYLPKTSEVMVIGSNSSTYGTPLISVYNLNKLSSDLTSGAASQEYYTPNVAKRNITLPNATDISAACWIPDGRILLVPRGVFNLMSYDPVSDTVTNEIDKTYVDAQFSFALPINDGSILLVPYNINKAGLFKGYWMSTGRFTYNDLLSALPYHC